MPARNTIRSYASNHFYHIYNRGVEKREIFLDTADYKMFLYYLFIYLAPLPVIKKFYPKLNLRLQSNNMFGKVELHTYCLMPNHFHFLIKQLDENGITKFLRQLSNAYIQYFNKKYNRVGSLMQGKFKASHIDSDEYVLQVSRYIHRNPLPFIQSRSDLDKRSDLYPKLEEYPWSSYRIYLGLQKSFYIKTDFMLEYFSHQTQKFNYQSFVEYAKYGDSSFPSDLTLE